MPRFPGNSAHSPYARCSPPVCLMLTPRIPGTWEIFAKRPKSGMCLHPISPMNRELDEKRWSRWKGQKIYRKDILKNKKHSPEKRCYIFFWNLHSFPLKPVTSFLERCYVLFWKVLCLFEKDVTSFQADRRYWCIWVWVDAVTTYFLRLLRLLYKVPRMTPIDNRKSYKWMKWLILLQLFRFIHKKRG